MPLGCKGPRGQQPPRGIFVYTSPVFCGGYLFYFLLIGVCVLVGFCCRLIGDYVKPPDVNLKGLALFFFFDKFD